MDRESIAELSRSLRECIARVEQLTDDESESARSLRRVLALLWNACDELALVDRGEVADSP
jgi:hypothetical protein